MFLSLVLEMKLGESLLNGNKDKKKGWWHARVIRLESYASWQLSGHHLSP